MLASPDWTRVQTHRSHGGRTSEPGRRDKRGFDRQSTSGRNNADSGMKRARSVWGRASLGWHKG